jgi:hypothetical protein
LVAAVSLAPLLLEPLPVTFVAPWHDPAAAWASKLLVLLLMVLALVARAVFAAPRERGAVAVVVGLALVAAILAFCHEILVDAKHYWPLRSPQDYFNWHIQRTLYLSILNCGLGGLDIPHAFRPLPYGFTRALELVTGDWLFACRAYRWFFTFWFLDGYYRFVRLFHPRPQALLALSAYVVLYPVSIYGYSGQLTDPMSHVSFAFAYLYVVQNRWALLAGVLALGTLAKETVVAVIPAYAAAYWRGGRRTLAVTSLLTLAFAAAYLGARLPYGWRPGNRWMNGVGDLMFWSNLGFYNAQGLTSISPATGAWHLFFFVIVFLPFVALHWRRTDHRLKSLFLVVTPLILGSSVCYSWLYESRNLVPLLPLLTTMALPPQAPKPLNDPPPASSMETMASK